MRSNYWSCSALADWIRGTKKPGMGTHEEWDQWNTAARTKHSFRYWLAEEGLDLLQDLVMWPRDQLNNLRYYINNRWISRSHALTSHARDISPGQWHDVGWRFLPCMFNELQDFVEIEQAWHHMRWDEEAQQRFQPPWYRSWLGLRGWRCPEAGLAYLDWASELRADETWGLDPGDEGYGELTPQAKNAREIKALYLWWTQVYRNRPDASEASGWSAVCDRIRDANNGALLATVKDKKLKREQGQALKRLHKIESDYEREEEAMMIRLIRVRHSLWT